MFELFVLGALGAVLFSYFSKGSFETVDGVRHFTADAQLKAFDMLADVGVSMGTDMLGSFMIVPLGQGSATGIETFQAAESVGGVVLLSESFLSHPIGSRLVVTSRGQEGALATPGSGLAVLSTV